MNDLAGADENRVLRLWQGLGYYSRARNLHRCAKVVAEKYDGVFPSTFEELIELPGVGSYTAAAIASIAFNRKVAVVDGNVYRVLSRVFGIDKDITSTEGKSAFAELANRLIPFNNPGDHNQAVMEFGAMHCTPGIPNCSECVFSRKCVAYGRNIVDQLPVKTKKTAKRIRYFYYFVLRDGKKIGMKQRTGRDIWKGLYEFYLIESANEKKLADLAKSSPLLVGARESGSIRHVLTHQLLNIRFFEVDLKKGNLTKTDGRLEGLSFISAKAAAEMPKPIAITRYLENAGT